MVENLKRVPSADSAQKSSLKKPTIPSLIRVVFSTLPIHVAQQQIKEARDRMRNLRKESSRPIPDKTEPIGYQRVAELFESHFERVCRYIYLRMGDEVEAEDLAIDVFERALRGIGSFRETGAPLEAWLFKIAHNRVVDYLRQKGRKPIHVDVDEVFSLEDQAADHDPVKVSELKEDLLRIDQTLAAVLSPNEIALVRAFYFSGKSYEEIAKMLGKKTGALRQMNSMTVRKLRGIIEQEEQGQQRKLRMDVDPEKREIIVDGKLMQFEGGLSWAVFIYLAEKNNGEGASREEIVSIAVAAGSKDKKPASLIKRASDMIGRKVLFNQSIVIRTESPNGESRFRLDADVRFVGK